VAAPGGRFIGKLLGQYCLGDVADIMHVGEVDFRLNGLGTAGMRAPGM
jgi:hypothetical protein